MWAFIALAESVILIFIINYSLYPHSGSSLLLCSSLFQNVPPAVCRKLFPLQKSSHHMKESSLVSFSNWIVLTVLLFISSSLSMLPCDAPTCRCMCLHRRWLPSGKGHMTELLYKGKDTFIVKYSFFRLFKKMLREAFSPRRTKTARIPERREQISIVWRKRHGSQGCSETIYCYSNFSALCFGLTVISWNQTVKVYITGIKYSQ